MSSSGCTPPRFELPALLQHEKIELYSLTAQLGQAPIPDKLQEDLADLCNWVKAPVEVSRCAGYERVRLYPG
jgi:hypothetical protein